MNILNASRPAPTLLLFLAAAHLLQPVSRGRIFGTDFAEALAKAKQEKRPICLFYAPADITLSAAFSEAMVMTAMRDFVCVQAYKEEQAQVEKIAGPLSGDPTYLFIDSATEKLIAIERGVTISTMRLMKCVTKTRAESGFPLTDGMQRSLAMEFTPDPKLLQGMTEAGDMPGLLAYLKPLENDEFRDYDYLVLQVGFPRTLSHGEVACLVSGREQILPPSGICAARVARDRKLASVRITAPGCVEIIEDINSISSLISRKYQLVPLPKAMAASFTGRVFFPDGMPATNAIVRVCDTGVVARTNRGGRFSATGIPFGTFLVRAEAPGGEYHQQLTFAAGKTQVLELPLKMVGTFGIRWALQNLEGSRNLVGTGVRTGEAYFSIAHSRFILDRGAEFRFGGRSDFILKPMTESFRPFLAKSDPEASRNLKVGEPIFSLMGPTTWPSGLHRESASFDAIAAVNGGLPFDDSAYFSHYFPVRVGDVFTLRCGRRNCYAKIQVIDVTPGKP